MVRMEYLLDSLEDYALEGYKPAPGTVVEILGASMDWNLGTVSNIYAAPDEYAINFEDLLDSVDIVEETTKEDIVDGGEKEGIEKKKTKFTLKMGRVETYCCTAITQDTERTGMLSHGNDPDEVRPPGAAVWAVFGFSPRYWMQWQLVEAEDQMRFERYHAFDFEEINWNNWIMERFDAYLNHNRNKKFKEYYLQQSEGRQEALKKIIFEPFDMMDRIINKWFDDFDEPVSCYRYLSFLGRDWFFVLLCLVIQWVLPTALFVSSIRDHSAEVERMCKEDTDEVYISYKKGTWNSIYDGCDSHKVYRPRRRDWTCWWAFFGIVLFYMLKVVPDEFHNFYSVASESDDTLSKLTSLRRSVYLRDEDTKRTFNDMFCN